MKIEKNINIKGLRLFITVYFNKKLDFHSWIAATEHILEGMLSIGFISIDVLWWHNPIR